MHGSGEKTYCSERKEKGRPTETLADSKISAFSSLLFFYIINLIRD